MTLSGPWRNMAPACIWSWRGWWFLSTRTRQTCSPHCLIFLDRLSTLNQWSVNDFIAALIQHSVCVSACTFKGTAKGLSLFYKWIWNWKKSETNVKYKYYILFMECTREHRLLIIHQLKIIYMMKWCVFESSVQRRVKVLVRTPHSQRHGCCQALKWKPCCSGRILRLIHSPR